ncbi:MAG: spore protease YyaC [Syntrophomonadaceae bacterium]|nr:spore protease YyaC [Syntrophomonadaceae bacterium]
MLSSIANSKINFSFYYEDLFCFTKMEASLGSMLSKHNKTGDRQIIYVCIGTDRATGDCLGPLVGTRLKTLLPHAKLYGTLKDPVHASNLQQILTAIENTSYKPLIIAVDACLGKAERIGFININQGSLRPGSALNRTLPAVGDFHISGVVNTAGFLSHLVLQNTRLFLVDRMAEVISKSLFLAHCKHQDSLCTPLL